MQQIEEIDDLSAEKLHIFKDLSESQLLHYYEPKPGIFIAESPNVIERALNAGYEPMAVLMEKEQYETRTGGVEKVIALLEATVPMYLLPRNQMKELTGYELTRGMLCAMRRKELVSAEKLLEECTFRDKKRVVVLEGVVNPTNVGAIFRSAAALNMDAVILTHDCSDPLYKRAARVSMGTVFQIPWTILSKDEVAVDKMHELGYKTVAMALKDTSVSITDPNLKAEEKLAIFMGAEGDGLPDSTIDACDYTIKIPMSHGVDSLNVAAASAVAFWELGGK